MKKRNIRNYQRDKEIFELRQSGMTFEKLGKRYGISGERIRQLYSREKDRRNSE